MGLSMENDSDLNKQVNEIIFSRKLVSNNLSHPPVKFNNNNITRCSHQTYLGVVLDSNLNCNTHIDQKIKKCNKMIGLIRRLSVNLLRNALRTLYKSFVRSHLDYSDILYDKSSNDNFQNKMEKVQYRACLAITGGIQGTSREWLYDELGLHSLFKRHWRNKLVFFYKIVNRLLPDYLYSYLDFSSQENYLLRLSSASVARPVLTRTKSWELGMLNPLTSLKNLL